MKRIAAFVCSLALASVTIASASDAPVIPWTNFSGDMVKAGIKADLFPCPQGEIFGAGFRGTNGDFFVMLFNPATNAVVFYYMPSADADPTFIGHGIVDPDKHDYIPAITWRPFTKADGQANSCAVMNPAGA